MSTDSDRRTAIIVPSERPKARRPRLVVIAGTELGRVIDLADTSVEIGRGEQSTLRVDSDLVSRRHAQVERIANRYVLVDAGSTNGTFVNDKKIRTHPLREGDIVRIGKTVLRYSEDDADAEFHHRMMSMARTDALTGLFNKQHFDEVFRKEAATSQSTGRPLSLVIFDIDHFKKINDTHGHLAGDGVLRDFAGAVRELLSPDAVLCRVGGEEFALVLPGVSEMAARDIAEKMRKVIAEGEFTFDGGRIPVTTSAGVAQLEAGEPSEALYRRSDERLYRAKRSGRNRVE